MSLLLALDPHLFLHSPAWMVREISEFIEHLLCQLFLVTATHACLMHFSKTFSIFPINMKSKAQKFTFPGGTSKESHGLNP
jgi:hypothetical protein